MEQMISFSWQFNYSYKRTLVFSDNTLNLITVRETQFTYFILRNRRRFKMGKNHFFNEHIFKTYSSLLIIMCV